jgi:transcriptional regulator with XRE-family HTH domain
MPEKSVNEVLAENLRYWMEQANMTAQGDLAEKSGVSQRTISNYLNPGNRQESASGKEPSAKLTELQKIAVALGIGVWDLVRPMTPQERAFYKKVEQAYTDLMAGEREPSTVVNLPTAAHKTPSRARAGTGAGFKRAKVGATKKRKEE